MMAGYQRFARNAGKNGSNLKLMLGNAKIPFEYPRLKMRVGQTTIANATSFPADTYPDPIWTVSNALIISATNPVSTQVTITALAVGSAYVIATVQGVDTRLLVEVFADGPDFIIVTTSKPQ